MLENSIFRNPAKWAETLTKTRRRYVMLSAMNVIIGAVLILLYSIGSGDLWVWLRNGVLFTILTIEMPLYYLRALRTLILEKQKIDAANGI